MQTSKPLLALIVGMSRGGTTWMSKCLGKHSQIAVFGESLFWGRQYIPPGKDGYYSKSQTNVIKNRLKKKGILGHGVGAIKNINKNNISDILDRAFEVKKGRLTPSEVFLTICSAVAQKENKQWAIEKTPHHLNSINAIKKNFPDLKFIIMYRELYSFLLSYKHQIDRQNLPSHIKEIKTKMYHPIGGAIVWKKSYQHIKREKEKQDKNTFFVNFSDIKSSPEKMLVKIQTFLNIELENSIISPPINTSFPGDKKPQLSSGDIFWANIICRKEIKHLGIKRLKGNNTADIIQSILETPLWVIHFIKYKRKEVQGNLFIFFLKWLGIKN